MEPLADEEALHQLSLDVVLRLISRCQRHPSLLICSLVTPGLESPSPFAPIASVNDISTSMHRTIDSAPDEAMTLPRRVHLIGAGGAGLSGAARLLVGRGHLVTGHDRDGSPFSDSLEPLGIQVRTGPSEEAFLPEDAEAVVRSAAVPEEDPQVALARERGLAVHKYSEVLPLLCPPERTLAVAGTHGKTTTSWMLYHALLGVAGDGPAPGALVGGTHRQLTSNAVAEGPGGWFAVEACEYDRSFLRLDPRGAIVTNLEADHLDYYGTVDAVEEAFARFVHKVHPDGLLVLGRDVPERIEVGALCQVWRMGRELHVDLLAEERGHFALRLRGPGWATPPIGLRVPGAFNVENAALALAMAIGLPGRGREGEVARGASTELGEFPGVGRRFESWGLVSGVEVVHDYAHHPTEVAATLEATRRTFPGLPVHVLFQPHQHSRTARFLDGFVESLRQADRVIVADVYGARVALEETQVTSEDLAMRLRRAGLESRAAGPAPRAALELVDGVPREAVVLVMGAGDIDRVRDDLLGALALRRTAQR